MLASTVGRLEAQDSCTSTGGSPQTYIPVAGGSFPITVIADAGCSWTVSTTASWISFPTGFSSGSGNQTATFIAAANSTAAPRQGTITIAFADGSSAGPVPVYQNSSSCLFSFNPTSASFPASGG